MVPLQNVERPRNVIPWQGGYYYLRLNADF